MAIRKPRSDPKNAARAFEALVYPALIDRIFDAAPFESLLVLRSICKGWKHRADTYLVQHVIYSFKGPRAGQFITTTPRGPLPPQKWYTSQLITHTKYLDLLTAEWPKWIEKALGLKVIRRRTDRSALVSIMRAAPTTPDPTFIDSFARPHTVITLGVHTSLPPWAVPAVSYGKQSPQSLCIITMGLPTTGKLKGQYPGGNFDTLLHYVARHLKKTLALKAPCPDHETKTTCFVRSTPCGNVDWVCKSDDKFRELLFERLTGSKARNITVTPVDAADAKKLMDNVTFLSLDEYRELVGDDQLRFETELLQGNPATWS